MTHGHDLTKSNYVTLIMLTAGVLIPLFGPLIGLALLWESSAWRIREKLWGTLLPFEAGALGLMLFLPASMTRPGPATQACHLAIVLLVLILASYSVYRLMAYRR